MKRAVETASAPKKRVSVASVGDNVFVPPCVPYDCPRAHTQNFASAPATLVLKTVIFSQDGLSRSERTLACRTPAGFFTDNEWRLLHAHAFKTIFWSQERTAAENALGRLLFSSAWWSHPYKDIVGPYEETLMGLDPGGSDGDESEDDEDAPDIRLRQVRSVHLEDVLLECVDVSFVANKQPIHASGGRLFTFTAMVPALPEL